MQIQVVDVKRLSEHLKASALIPEMTETEWNDFLKNVEGNGIRQPIDINKKYEVLDGRHRLRAAKKLGIEQIEVRLHDLTEDEEMRFVRDTAIERRSLTPAQKLDIILNTEELIRSVYEEGKEKISKTTSDSNKVRVDDKSQLVSAETSWKTPHDSLNKIAEMAGLSRSSVGRMKRLKKEAPEKYEEVVKGEKTVKGAYDELPKKFTNTEQENKKSVSNTPTIPQEEIGKQMFNANVSTFVMHVEQLIGFMERVEDVNPIITEATNRLDATRCTTELKKIIKLLKIGGNTNE